MKFRIISLIVLVVGLLVVGGCQVSGESAPSVDTSSASGPALSGNIDRDMQNRGLDGVNFLVLGTFELEGSANAVTPEQAAKLLPLWKLIQGGSLQSAAETEAVIKQIEGQMTDAQLAAIAAMDLNFEDYQAWMAEQGIDIPALGAGTGAGALNDLSEDERAAIRERMQEMRDMTPDERAAAIAEMGIDIPAGGPGAGRGTGAGDGGGGRGFGSGGASDGNQILALLIELLTARAAESL